MISLFTRSPIVSLKETFINSDDGYAADEYGHATNEYESANGYGYAADEYGPISDANGYESTDDGYAIWNAISDAIICGVCCGIPISGCDGTDGSGSFVVSSP